MQLPLSPFPLLELAKKTSTPTAVRQAIKEGVMNFFFEAWIAYAATELDTKNMLDGVTPVGALVLGKKIFENIEEDFVAQDNKKDEVIEGE